MAFDLTPHFTLAELTFTQVRGADNSLPADLLPALTDTAGHMERVREILGHPIIVTSGYRSPAVNAAVGGSKDSAHMQARAVDFICPGFGSPREVCVKLADTLDLKFDQLIEEGGGWAHISFDPRMRREVLTARFRDGVATYQIGLVR